jgi:cytochrome b
MVRCGEPRGIPARGNPEQDRMAETVRVKVWDGWVRAFHWSIVALLAASWWTGENQLWEWHFLSGFAMLALLVFRILWGILGSDTARFSRFLRSPLAAFRHLAHLRRREPDTEIGHNAAGGWVVLLMLALLLTQAVTGLFADDEIFTRGPLARSVSPATVDWATFLHLRVINAILVLVALHVLAVLLYRLLKGHDLVRAMVTGAKQMPAGTPAPRLASPLLGLVLLAIAAGGVWYLSTLGG